MRVVPALAAVVLLAVFALPPAAAEDAAVTVDHFAFEPSTVTVLAGETVTWTFLGGTAHNVQFDTNPPDEGDCDGALKGDATCTRRFSTPGTTSYRCGIHPSMMGAVIVEGREPDNAPPVARFTYEIDGLTVRVDAATSSDAEGAVASYAWNWGDGSTGSGITPFHEYAAGGSFLVTLTVQDADGATDDETQSIQLETPVDPSATDEREPADDAQGDGGSTSGGGSEPTGETGTSTGAANGTESSSAPLANDSAGRDEPAKETAGGSTPADEEVPPQESPTVGGEDASPGPGADASPVDGQPPANPDASTPGVPIALALVALAGVALARRR